jgi:hypothetical protein
MTTAQRIRALLSTQLFRPFRIRTADGLTIRVHRPECALVLANGGAVLVRFNNKAAMFVETARIADLEFDE